MSAVVKENPIETIFDYELTDSEIDLLSGGMSKEEYMPIINQEGINHDLMSLFAIRGDTKKADFYMNLLDKDYVKLNIKWDLFSPAVH
jgi:hypothetical protein